MFRVITNLKKPIPVGTARKEIREALAADTGLDERQKEIAREIIKPDSVVVVDAPAASGKTYTICRILHSLLQGPNIQLIVCLAKTNEATQAMVNSLHRARVNPKNVILLSCTRQEFARTDQEGHLPRDEPCLPAQRLLEQVDKMKKKGTNTKQKEQRSGV